MLAACWHLQRSGLLTVDVRLSAQMTTFRYDLSSSCVVITQENPQTPALRIDRGEVYYNRFNIELDYSRRQSRRVPIEAAAQVKLDDEPSVEQVRRLFTALGLTLPWSFGDREVAGIIGKAVQARNPTPTSYADLEREIDRAPGRRCCAAGCWTCSATSPTGGGRCARSGTRSASPACRWNATARTASACTPGRPTRRRCARPPPPCTRTAGIC
ncbi:hypothetical protein V2I01_36160 [Micromonospora sp. BRA006-A]|nr:hypothetical protein [Micromonospora sp. BRA006-A]